MAFSSSFAGGVQLGQDISNLKKSQELEQLGQQYLGGDREAIERIGAISPEKAQNLIKIADIQKEKSRESLRIASNLAETVMKAGEEERPEVYRSALKIAQDYGIDISELPKTYSSETGNYLNQISKISPTLLQPETKYGKIPEGYALEKGRLKKLEGFEGTPEDREKVIAATENLRKEYTKESSEFIDSRNSYNRVLASSENPSPAGDVALIYNFMKLLDPKSTVREGEYARAENAGGIPSKIRVLYNKARDGKSLSTEMRQDFIKRSGNIYNAQLKSQKKLERQYRNIAKRQNLPEEEAIIDLYNDVITPTNGTSQGGMTGGQINNDPLGIR